MKNLASTPVLLAQEECKRVALNVAEVVIPFYEDGKNKGLISEYTIKFDTHNDGYELYIQPSWQFGKETEKPFPRTNFTVQPRGYFNDDYKEGRARIEYSLSIDNEYDSETFNIVGEIKIDESEIISKINNILNK